MLGEEDKGAIHLPEQAILILEREKKSRPTNEKRGKQGGAVKLGSARRKTKSKPPLPTKCRLGKRRERRRRNGAAAHLRGSSREGLGFPPALREERVVGFCCFEGRRDDSRGALIALFFSSTKPSVSWSRGGGGVARKTWVGCGLRRRTGCRGCASR